MNPGAAVAFYGRPIKYNLGVNSRESLTAEQQARLREALLAAFPRRVDLARMTLQELNVNLRRVSSGETQEAVVMDLLRWALEEDRLTALLEAALRNNPGHELLIATAQELQPNARPLHKENREITTEALLREAAYPLVQQIAQACRLREGREGVELERLEDPSGVLDGCFRVCVGLDADFSREYALGITAQECGARHLQAFRKLHDGVRAADPGAVSVLVCGGTPAAELAQEARRHRIRLTSVRAYQELIDFRPYLRTQMERLAADQRYPAELYVPQRLRYRFGEEERREPNALEVLEQWVSEPQGRFVLVLGNFGHGKSFLLRQLARRLTHRLETTPDADTPIPLLIELRGLEKAQELESLIAQHLTRCGMQRIDLPAFNYMLEQGRLVLLFDGFDELALRVTYTRAGEHFRALLQAVRGNARLVVTSRTQHFENDHQVRTSLGHEVARLPRSRFTYLEGFDRSQIRLFLTRWMKDERRAEARMREIEQVRDLMGLSHNPRMLSFIAELEDEDLQAAKREGEAITAAGLYEQLIERWFRYEVQRAQPSGAPPTLSPQDRWEAVTQVALRLWDRLEASVNVRDLTEEMQARLLSLDANPVDAAGAAFQVGSGTLLQRDGEGNFSFIHQSVMEFLIARRVARDLQERGESSTLGTREFSLLMREFLVGLAEKEALVAWSLGALHGGGSGETAAMNARALLARLGRSAPERYAGKELRGSDFTGQDLRGAYFREANLREALLRQANLAEADLTGAELTGADLAGANLKCSLLTKARLHGARLDGAELDEADLTGASFVQASLLGTRLHGTHMEGADLWRARTAGTNPPLRDEQPLPLTQRPVGRIQDVALHPRGDVLAGACGSVVVLWDMGTGQELRHLAGHTGDVTSVGWDPQGEWLASGSDDRTVRIWEASTGRAVRHLQGHTGSVTSVAWHPQGEWLASGSDDRTVRIWEASADREVQRLKGHAGSVTSVGWDPQGERLASGSDDRTVRIWEASTGRELRRLEGHAGSVTAVAWHPQGERLVSGCDDRTLRIWEISTGRELRRLKGHTEFVTCVTWAPEGERLASGSGDRTVRIWEASTGRELRRLDGHAHWVRCVVWDPQGKRLASGSEDRTVRIWEASTGREVLRLKGHTVWVRCVAWDWQGQRLASASHGETVRIWETSTGREVQRLDGHRTHVTCVAWHPQGERLASGSDDETVRIWEASTGREVQRLDGHRANVTSVAWHPQGVRLASGCDDRTLRIWEASTGRELRRLEGHGGSVTSVAWHPQGERLVSGSSDRTVRIWEASTGRELRRLEGHTNSLASVAWHPQGERLVSGSSDRTVRIWEASTGRELQRMQRHTSRVTAVAWSAGGERLASGDEKGVIQLWTVQLAQEPVRVAGHEGGVLALAWDPWGKRLASGSEDGTIRIWDVESGRCLAVLAPLPEGWAAFTPEGRYRVGGDPTGFWHAIGLCRYEPGELDPYYPGLRLKDDELLIPPPA